jgi:pyridoxine/pyridoxamine 5'-phosphate oxidase
MVKNPQVPVSELRISYDLGVLTQEMLAADPVEQFGRWFEYTRNSAILEPNAMVVSTVGLDPQGNARPASRTVLLKDFSDSGFSFYTNLGSAKSSDLVANPNVTLLFPWYELHRQVIISGKAQLVSRTMVRNISIPVRVSLRLEPGPVSNRQFWKADKPLIRGSRITNSVSQTLS